MGQAFFRILCLVLKRKKRDHALLLHSFFFSDGEIMLVADKKNHLIPQVGNTPPQGDGNWDGWNRYMRELRFASNGEAVGGGEWWWWYCR